MPYLSRFPVKTNPSIYVRHCEELEKRFGKNYVYARKQSPPTKECPSVIIVISLYILNLVFTCIPVRLRTFVSFTDQLRKDCNHSTSLYKVAKKNLVFFLCACALCDEKKCSLANLCSYVKPFVPYVVKNLLACEPS
jgi:hypothetical protein